ncbi:MAG: tRNA (guanosine(37)-N1)-methyltransferase TrmD [Gammaproteobacteria bacterium]|nr:tRNA (guanosine(37)-N1)-methyltransferase TrmD [Gammaproteobacteria bacterium]
MKFSIITLFPELFKNYFSMGVVGRAVQNNLVSVDYYNPRDYTDNKYGSVDDKPYGGGAGLVLSPQPLIEAINTAKKHIPDAKVIYLTPQGNQLTQKAISVYAEEKKPLVLLCGRYEGIDQRVIEHYVDQEYSIGDYILSGGELPALVLLDSIIRLLPGALGDAKSAQNDSFSENLSGFLEYPHYTRPNQYIGLKVPEVLQSGNHQQIKRWREKQVLGRTWLRRPNLLECVRLTLEQQELLAEFILEIAD